MKKICIISDLHLSANPRVWKEANSLAAAGYDVVIQTTWTSAEKRKLDDDFIQQPGLTYTAGLNLIPGEVSALRRFYYRFRAKLAREMQRFFSVSDPWSLGYAPGRIAKLAIRQQADLYIAHTEFGIVVGNRLRAKGLNVAFDIEDWYSRDYLVASRPVTLLANAERMALTNGVYCTCPSMSMSDGLLKAYEGSRKAEVIYNGFSLSETADLPQTKISSPLTTTRPSSLVWFSQTIGPGRGLETLVESLRQIRTPLELHLIGDCIPGYDTELEKQLPANSGHRLVLHRAVKHAALPSILAGHSIGLAIENNTPDNKDTTVSNKMLQYLQVGIKVLATATAGQKEVAAFFPDAVSVVPVGKPDDWARAIESLLAASVDPVTLQATFARHFSWEAQEKHLLALVGNALTKPQNHESPIRRPVRPIPGH
jgi:glycosyltransferase involved in cell wall biosynthesis